MYSWKNTRRRLIRIYSVSKICPKQILNSGNACFDFFYGVRQRSVIISRLACFQDDEIFIFQQYVYVIEKTTEEAG